MRISDWSSDVCSFRSYSEGILDKAISRGKSTEEKKAELLGRIKPTADPADLTGCDLVIEAVFEDPSLKAKVFAEVAPYVNKEIGRASCREKGVRTGRYRWSSDHKKKKNEHNNDK